MLSKQNVRLMENMTRKLLSESYSADDFVWIDPQYTGGGIYVVLGQLADDTWFMADWDSLGIGVMFLDADVKAAGEDAWWPEWQENHVIRYLEDNGAEALDFADAIIEWLGANQPKGNYTLGELEDMRDKW